MPDPTTPEGVTTPPTSSFVGSTSGEPIGEPAAPSGAPAGTATPPAGAPPGEAAGDESTGEPSGDTGRIMLSEEGLKARLDRAARKAAAEARAAALKELGIEDPEKYKSDKSELAKLREQAEAREREKLSTEERLKADYEAEKAKREAAEAKLKEVKVTSVYDKQDAKIQQIGSAHVAPKYWNYARHQFVEHIATLTPQQTARMNDKDVERWFAKFVRDEPAFGHPSGEAPKAEPVKPRRRPITTTKPAARVETPPNPAKASSDPSASPDGKTIKPGQPNSMNRGELNAELKRRGISGWR